MKELVSVLTLKKQGFDSGLSGATNSVKKFKKSLEGMSTGLKSGLGLGSITKFAGWAGAALAVGDAIKKNIELNMEFEDRLSNLSALTGLTGDKLEGLKKQIQQTGVETSKSFSEIADAYTLVGSKMPVLLKNTDALDDMTRATITLAKASRMNLADATEYLTSIMNQFGAGAEQAYRYINVLSAGSQKGSGNVQYLAEAINNCGTVLNSAGLSIEETSALVEVLAEKIPEASKAGINLRNVFLQLMTMGNEYNPKVVGLATAFKNLSKHLGDATWFSKNFGKENASAAMMLTQNIDKLQKLQKELTGTQTAFEQAKIQGDNLASSLTKLSNNWDILVQSIYNSNGGLKWFIDRCNSLIERLNRERLGDGTGGKDTEYKPGFNKAYNKYYENSEESYYNKYYKKKYEELKKINHEREVYNKAYPKYKKKLYTEGEMKNAAAKYARAEATAQMTVEGLIGLYQYKAIKSTTRESAINSYYDLIKKNTLEKLNQAGYNDATRFGGTYTNKQLIDAINKWVNISEKAEMELLTNTYSSLKDGDKFIAGLPALRKQIVQDVANHIYQELKVIPVSKIEPEPTTPDTTPDTTPKTKNKTPQEEAREKIKDATDDYTKTMERLAREAELNGFNTEKDRLEASVSAVNQLIKEYLDNYKFLTDAEKALIGTKLEERKQSEKRISEIEKEEDAAEEATKAQEKLKDATDDLVKRYNKLLKGDVLGSIEKIVPSDVLSVDSPDADNLRALIDTYDDLNRELHELKENAAEDGITIDTSEAEKTLEDLKSQIIELSDVIIHSFNYGLDKALTGLNAISTTAHTIDSVASSFKNSKNALDYFIASIDSLISILETFKVIQEGVAAVSKLVSVSSTAQAAATTANAAAQGTNTASTQASIAADTAKTISSKAVTAALMEQAAAGYMAAHAYIPFAGYGIGAGFTASALATVKGAGAIGLFAQGGIVGGSSTHGDSLLAGVNSQEMILNGKQQRNLFNLLNSKGFSGSEQSGQVEFKISGSDLKGCLRNYDKKMSRI